MPFNVSYIAAIIWFTYYIISSMCPLFVTVLCTRYETCWLSGDRILEQSTDIGRQRESPWPCVTDSFLAAHDQLHCFIHVIMINVNYDGLSQKNQTQPATRRNDDGHGNDSATNP